VPGVFKAMPYPEYPTLQAVQDAPFVVVQVKQDGSQVHIPGA